MTYTDGRQSPKPTTSEREFAKLTDNQREDLTIAWLWDHAPDELGKYARTFTPTQNKEPNK